MTQNNDVLIATLGGKPQVITFALDLFLQADIRPADVVLVHLSDEDPRIARALNTLADAFRHGVYGGYPMQLHTHPLHDGPRPLHHVASTADTEAVWRTFVDLFRYYKAERRRVHLLVAGGPRLLGALALSAAMFTLYQVDEVWHVFTPRDVRLAVERDGRLHPRPEDGAHLVKLPFLGVGRTFPLPLGEQVYSSEEVLHRQRRILDNAHRQRCETVWKDLSRRERDVLTLYAQGLSTGEIAARLHLSTNTVNTYRRRIFERVRNVWELPDDHPLRYHQLVDYFGVFCEEYVNWHPDQ
nr:CRISPR-associated ring nuclease [Ardenticatena sp.]